MESYIKETLEIVKAQAGVRTMTENELASMIKNLAASIHSINIEPQLIIPENDTSFDPKKAIKEKSITCVICGKVFKLLTKKHIATHGQTVEEYREFCGYKKGTPLVCKALQRERREKMQNMRLWERR